MKYRNIGTTGLRVSEIAFGSWITFGNQVELDGAKELFKTAFEQGINYIDTADVYENGKAEKLIGKILPEYNRRHYVIATKAYWPMSDHETDKGLSRKHITDSVHQSLDRLQLKYIDIFYCHRFDPEVPLKESIRAMEDLIRQGKILYWGTSVWTGKQIAQAYSICKAEGWHPPIINQPPYNLAYRDLEKVELPVCDSLGMGTAVFSPLAQGILTGKYSGGVIPKGTRGANDALNTWMRDSLKDGDLLSRVDALKPIADSYGISIATLALAFLLHTPGITSVIVGATKTAQLIDNCKASGIELKPEDLKTIKDLFPLL